MPLGFVQYSKNGIKICRKLTKTLYGLWQSHQAFWKYITKKLKSCGLEQSNLIRVFLLEQRLSVLSTLMISWNKNMLAINDSTMQLRELGVDLEQEDDTTGFLGVQLE